MPFAPEHFLECDFISEQHAKFGVHVHAFAIDKLQRDAATTRVVTIWAKELLQNHTS